MNQNNEISALKTFFSSLQVHLSDIWLDSCINWCKSEVVSPNYTLKELQSMVYQQWLLLDLRDMEVACLPQNLSSEKHFVLTGNFSLQMMNIIDISKPKFWQLQRIRNQNALTRDVQESDASEKSKRALQLTLTDGVQEVEAMEYRPVPQLNLNLVPGVKIRIMGPVTVRRGRIMLEQQNVKVLGGEVEELLVSHAAENVLARALKLPENPAPRRIEDKFLSAPQEEEVEETVVNRPRPQPKPPAPAAPPPRPVVVTTNDEQLDINEEVNYLLQAEREALQQNQNTSKTPDLFENVEFNDADFANIGQVPASTQINRVQNPASTSLLDDDDDVFSSIDIEAHLNEIDISAEQGQAKAQPTVLTIAKITQLKSNVTKGIFKVRAKFKSVVEKLTSDAEEYRLIIKIEDGTGELVARMHSDIIGEFTGHSPAYIFSLKPSIANRDGAAINKLMQAMEKVKDRLLELNHLMGIEIVKNELPVIVKIYE